MLWELCSDGALRSGRRYDYSEQVFWLLRAGVWYLLVGVTPDGIAQNLAKSEPELEADKGSGLPSEVVWQWRQRSVH